MHILDFKLPLRNCYAIIKLGARFFCWTWRLKKFMEKYYTQCCWDVTKLVYDEFFVENWHTYFELLLLVVGLWSLSFGLHTSNFSLRTLEDAYYPVWEFTIISAGIRLPLYQFSAGTPSSTAPLMQCCFNSLLIIRSTYRKLFNGRMFRIKDRKNRENSDFYYIVKVDRL